MRRCLLVQPLAGEASPDRAGTRERLAIYDAPEPWGPWTLSCFPQNSAMHRNNSRVYCFARTAQRGLD
ncbi:MAG: hypothetical protein FJ403_15495 [Verrucomicrobia bacterium]|nr:hypothetical protein [Verrucomicrobiota bacterium]